jgi:hypothetical protein
VAPNVEQTQVISVGERLLAHEIRLGITFHRSGAADIVRKMINPEEQNAMEPQASKPEPIPSSPPSPADAAEIPPHTVKRSEEHITDTLAVRKVVAALSKNWLIRDLTERDYGIDMMVEYFDGKVPTGRIAFLQIKGTTKPLKPRNGLIPFSIKKKTLKYTECFAVPFFLVHCNVNDPKGPVYYMWLQKYVMTALYTDNPQWRTLKEETCTVYIPASNILPETEERMLEFCHTPQRTSETLQFLSHLYDWKVHFKGLTCGHLKAVTPCKELLEKMSRLETVLRGENIGAGDLLEGVGALERLGLRGFAHAQAELDAVLELNEDLELFETGVLWTNFDLWKLEGAGELPY